MCDSITFTVNRETFSGNLRELHKSGKQMDGNSLQPVPVDFLQFVETGSVNPQLYNSRKYSELEVAAEALNSRITHMNELGKGFNCDIER